MQQLSKAILNYFAAFTETRFNFKRVLDFAWSNDDLTLDFGLFPELIQEVYDTSLTLFEKPVLIRKDQYSIRLDSELMHRNVALSVQEILSPEQLEAHLLTVREQIATAGPEPQTELEKMRVEKTIWQEACRKLNIQVRQAVAQSLAAAKQDQLQTLAVQFNQPDLEKSTSTFNIDAETRPLYDHCQRLALEHTVPREYVEQLREVLDTQSWNLSLIDPYVLLLKMQAVAGGSPLYIFFHQLNVLHDEDSPVRSYPLFFWQVMLEDGADTISLTPAEPLIYLNAPAINAAKFEHILALERAVSPEKLDHSLQAMESFLQVQYDTQQPLVRTTLPYHLTETPGKPTLQFRCGLQVIRKADAKIRDYSELLSEDGHGAAKAFETLIDTYVNSDVVNTVSEVSQQMRECYPDYSPGRFYAESPVPLNMDQKRILQALRHPKNKVIVVDGPPGTGKSHTITAIVYDAIAAKKRVVVTSHKPEALTVIDAGLTKAIKKVAQNIKPAILRLSDSSREVTDNSAATSLSAPVIMAATSRWSATNNQEMAADIGDQAARLESKIGQTIDNRKAISSQSQQLIEWMTLAKELEREKAIPLSVWDDVSLSAEGKSLSLESLTADIADLKSLESLESLQQSLDMKPQLGQLLAVFTQLRSKGIKELSSQQSPPCPVELKKTIEKLDGQLQPDLTLGEARILEVILDAEQQYDSELLAACSSVRDLEDITQHAHQIVDHPGNPLFRSKERKLAEASLKTNWPRYFDTHSIEEHKLIAKCEQLHRQLTAVQEKNPQLTAQCVFSLLKGTVAPEVIKQAIANLFDPSFAGVLMHISEKYALRPSDLTWQQCTAEIRELYLASELNELIHQAQALLVQLKKTELNIDQLTSELEATLAVVEQLTQAQLEVLVQLKRYSPVLEKAGITSASLTDIAQIAAPAYSELRQALEIHSQLLLAATPELLPSQTSLNQRVLKQVLSIADERMATLQEHAASTMKILVNLQNKLRLTSDQAHLLLDAFSCIIADPATISQHFPLESDLIDILIIDEASQVSIADSVSLLLRAKQIVVFGDELQYGAVGAVNVNGAYAKAFFDKVISGYSADSHEEVGVLVREQLLRDAEANPSEDEIAVEKVESPASDQSKLWLKTFNIRTSTLQFCKAIANFQTSLSVHFRSYPEIIGYSNAVFYQKAGIPLVINRIRTKPIADVLRFIRVQPTSPSAPKVNEYEIEAIRKDILLQHENGFRGTIGVITSFKDQAQRLDALLSTSLPIYHELKDKQSLLVWFVGDVQGEERDTVYYSFVQEAPDSLSASLSTIYPVTTSLYANTIYNLKKQRLNVGFSRAKDTMVFVHSMDIGEYGKTALGEALDWYARTLAETSDVVIDDYQKLHPGKERHVYSLLTQTPFFTEHAEHLRLIPQFPIGRYLEEEFRKYLPKYRADFLVVLHEQGKPEQSLIIEYDGVEFHTDDPSLVYNEESFSRQQLRYDVERQLELESYGYRFLRLNKFNLRPKELQQTEVDVLDKLLRQSFT